jgi:GLPGLI family protein|tara:strand:- start:532 stop:1323 length:792 start_codon:yes stop_codon:yes gene_type:complete
MLLGHSQSNSNKKNDVKIMYQFDYKKHSNSEKLVSENTTLIIDNNKSSIFTYQKMINLDSIQRVRELDITDVMSNRLSVYSFIAYSNDSITHYETIGNDLLKFKEPISSNWKLINEKKQISGYNCKKAIINYAGREWVAWFTSEIALNSGPYKFHGLPGLIIELYDTENIFSFKAYAIKYGDFEINNNTLNYFITEDGDKFQELDRKDFLSIRNKYYQMSLNQKLKYMNRNEEGNHELIVSSIDGGSINTNRKPKIRNFIERN